MFQVILIERSQCANAFRHGVPISLERRQMCKPSLKREGKGQSDRLGLAVELAPLDVDAVLADGHAEVLHRQHRPVLAPALSAAAVTRALDS